MKLPTTRIGTRLRLTYAVLLGLTLALAAVGLNRLSHLSQALKDVVAEVEMSQERLRNVNVNAEVAARKLLVLIGAPREGRVDAYAAIDTANRRLDESMAVLRAHPGSEALQKAFAEVEFCLGGFRKSYAETIDLIEAEEFDAARRMLGSQTEPALSSLTEALSAYSAVEQQSVEARSAELQQLAVRDKQIVLGLCAVALVLGFALAGVVTRSIVRPLRRTQAGARRIAAGHYEHRVVDCSVDEVGQLGTSLNQLAEAVAEREAARVDAAETETLTQLARRPRFVREGRTQLGACSRSGEVALLACLDVDRLKPINALLGFDAGDALLSALADRLREAAGPRALLGRLSGGAFVALLPLADESHAEARVSELQAALEHRFDWRGQALDVAVTLGVAVFPEDGAGPEAMELLLRRAEAAMYEAKRAKLRSLRFDPSWELARAGQLSLLSALREAIEHGQLRQVLQPKVDTHTGELLGAEALVRWQHPVRGFMNPGEFIPFAEQTGRIRDLTRWMIARAIHNLATLPALQAEGRYLAVNISTLDLADEDLPDWIAAQLRDAGVAPQRLQLEVTESGLMASGNRPVEVLAALRGVGLSLALDDFGTGQSSLAYLQRLPVNELKIDRSFVDKVDLDARRQYLLTAIVDLGHSLGLKVTAEGVETPQELAVLQRAGADLLQGYLVSRPLDEGQFAQWQGRTLPIAKVVAP